MIRTIWTSVLAGLTAATLVACGGGGTAKDTANQDAGAAMNETASGRDAAGDETPAMTPESADTAAGAVENADALPEPGTYKTVYDPNAVYTAGDITMRGSYLKIDFEDLTASQVNRVVHRLRTEYCTCGCDKDTIDQCLVNDPDCTTAVTLAKQIIREERTKS